MSLGKGDRPAFPRAYDQRMGVIPAIEEGMTIRQYYKAAALQGITQAFGNFQSVSECADKVAIACAKISEFMIAEDERHEANEKEKA